MSNASRVVLPGPIRAYYLGGGLTLRAAVARSSIPSMQRAAAFTRGTFCLKLICNRDTREGVTQAAYELIMGGGNPRALLLYNAGRLGSASGVEETDDVSTLVSLFGGVRPAFALGEALLPKAIAKILGRGGAAKAGTEVAEEVATKQVTVLGRYVGGTEHYIGEPGFNVLNVPGKGAGRWNWTRNKRFIDDAIERGDEIRLVTNPYKRLYSGGNTYQRELKYLNKRGYGQFEQSGDYWVARPGR